ncbi:MAG TPA: conjugal transfer protein [Streptosporangiaceae bacterium]|jgi:hypothetical protein
MGRATLESGFDERITDEALPPGNSPAPDDRPQVHWRGAGGRWLVWVGRAVIWAVVILVGYRGVLAIVQGPTPAKASGASTEAVSTARVPQFPVTLAEAYALQFGDVYLNFSPATATQRARSLAKFLPAGTSRQLGWNGTGTQHLLAEQVAGISVTSSHAAVVTLLARIETGRLVELGVPVYVARDSMAISGEPALLPAPANAVAPLHGLGSGDAATQAELQSQLPAFFQAYASGDKTTLARFVSPGARLTGLGGAVTFGSIDSVYAPRGGSQRQAVVTVTWELPAPGRTHDATASAAATLQMTYQLTVLRQGSSWDVQSIGTSTQGPP